MYVPVMQRLLGQPRNNPYVGLSTKIRYDDVVKREAYPGLLLHMFSEQCGRRILCDTLRSLNQPTIHQNGTHRA